MTVVARRQAVRLLVAQGLSQRRACVLLQLRRSTFGSQARPERNAELRTQRHALARRHPREGYRRVWALLRRRGQRVNKKHVHRLWKQARLQVPKVTRQRRIARRARIPGQATQPGHVWTDDVLHGRCLKGTPLKVLTVMDEFTREGLALAVATSWPATRVLASLQGLVVTPGAPQFVRSENGPAVIALAVRGGRAQHQMTTVDIEPGGPWHKGYGERVNGTVRDACLHMHVVPSVTEARVVLEASRRLYNAERPHSSLGYRTPAAFKRAWLAWQLSSMGL